MTIKVLVMDIDGTLTDGKIYIGKNGEIFKAFNIKDGYGINNMLKKNNIIPVIITGRDSKIVSKRCKEIGISHIYQGVCEKREKLDEILRKFQVSYEEVAYIGDDINDLSCIQLCGITACPNDAIDEVKKIVTYVCKNKGGDGAVREFIDILLEKK